MRSSPKELQDYGNTRYQLVYLVQELLAAKELRYVNIKKRNTAIHVDLNK